MFPYHLEEANFKPLELVEKKLKEEVVLDMRTDKKKKQLLSNDSK